MFHESGNECPNSWNYVSGYGRCVGMWSKTGRTYNDGVRDCLPYKMVLPQNDNENTALYNYRGNAEVDMRVDIWGGSKRKEGERQTWEPALTTITKGESPWATNEPSNANGGNDENCLQIRAGGKWNDEECGEYAWPNNKNVQGVMCERGLQCSYCSTADCGHGNYRHGCTSTTDSSCAACAAHTYGGLWRTSTCTDVCPVGQHVNTEMSGCNWCAAGTFSQGSVAACSPCRDNSWSGVGWGHCDCNAGYQDVSGVCTLCAVGQISTSGGTCSDCGAGQTDNGERTGCILCTTGYYSPVQSQCLPCAVGFVSATPFTQCVYCEDYMTSSGAGGMCYVPECPAGKFAPVDFVALAMHWDHDCEPCPYNSISVRFQTACVQCGVGKYANEAKTQCVPCGDAQFNTVMPWNPRGITVESEDESSERWSWLRVGELFSVRTPCTCASGRFAPVIADAVDGVTDAGFAGAGVAVATCRSCPVGRINHPALLELPGQANQLWYRTTEGAVPVPFNSIQHFTAQTICEECLAGSHYHMPEGGTVFQCQICLPGTAQPRDAQPTCLPCLLGQFASAPGLLTCSPCALCPEGQFRRGCGRLSRNATGACETCLLDCAEGEMPTACINRLGVSAEPPVCKRKEFLTRTPLCQSNRDGDTMDRGLGLGGFDFETIFGASELEVPFQCSRVCNARGGPLDTMTCDGPYACNRMSCTMESSYLDTDLNDFRVARACPVELSSAEKEQPLANIDMLRRKRQVGCQRCSECGDSPLDGVRGLYDWGRGCVRECSMVECLQNEVYDWTDHSCKLCEKLANVSLCTHEQSKTAQLATQDVSGNRPKLRFQGCRAKMNAEEEPLTYGACESCRSEAHDCSTAPGPAAYHSGCLSGCEPCLHKQNLVLSSARRFVSEEGRIEPLYCQVSECSTLPPDNAPRTGLKDMGSMCGRTCETSPCEIGTVRLECSLPHDTRCVLLHPVLQPGLTMQGFVAAHANLLEHPQSAHLHFSNFENTLLNVDGAAQDLHQCVWNAVDVRDNDMNPAGVSFTFFPPARTYANGLDEYGSKFCHRWQRDASLVYPLLPLQNTVSFDSSFPRRVLLNASARVLHYGYSGDGHSQVPSVAELPRPVQFPNVYAGDLFLNVDLQNTPNASVAVFVPDDRDIETAAWIPSFVFSALVADSTAPSTVSRPALGIESMWTSRTPQSMLSVFLHLDATATQAQLTGFAGVHCEPQLCRFAVPASHAAQGGSAWVSSNNVSQSDSPLPLVFAEMTLASPTVTGLNVVRHRFSLQLQDFSLIVSNMQASACNVLAVVRGVSLVCVRLSASSSAALVLPVNLGTIRLELQSRVVSLAARGSDTLALLQLSSNFGQQLLLHRHESSLTHDVQFQTPDVVALACDSLTDQVWLLRRVRTEAALQYTLARTQLVEGQSSGLSPRLEASNTVYPDMLANIFAENPGLALSDEDTHTLSVSVGHSLFVAFAFVPAQYRYLVIVQDSGDSIVEQCSLFSEYPGLDNASTSVAWTSASSLVLQLQDNLFSAQCDGSVLVLRHLPTASIPNRPFVQYGNSYLSLLSPEQLELSSNMLGANLAEQPDAAGFCVYVSSPTTALTITRLQNAYLGDRAVVLDADFDTQQLVHVSSLGFLDMVTSLRVLGNALVYVGVRLQPSAVLTEHSLYLHMRSASELGASRSAFWDTTAPHLLEVQLALPCAAHVTLGLTQLQARPGVHGSCGAACVVLHVTVIEAWDVTLKTSWHIAGGSAFVKDSLGSRVFAVPQYAELRLFEGARLIRVQEIAMFSSVQFACDNYEEIAARSEWQHHRVVTSAHSMRARQGLMLQVTRAPAERESWSIPRSLALDAIQVLVVLTAGVEFPLQASGVMLTASRQPSQVSSWMEHLHCCGPDTDLYLSVCPLENQNYVMSTRQDCALRTVLNGQPCVARSYMAARGSCHCHSTCEPQDMRITSQTGVALVLGRAVNFCPTGQYPTDLSLADTSPANCGANTPAQGAAQAARRLLAIEVEEAPSVFFVPMYVPTRAELSLLDLEHVLYGDNAMHTDDWQRIFVLVTLEARKSAEAMQNCKYRIRLGGLTSAHGMLPRSSYSRLHELGCTVRLNTRGVGECYLEVPTALALASAHRRAALVAEVVDVMDRERCEWPERDLFTASLVPYMSKNTCEHQQFWSEDEAGCVSCQFANNEIVDNVCGPGAYIRGCDAVAHLDDTECERCINADHNTDGSYEWLAGICQWQCSQGFFLDATARCEPCTTSLREVCKVTAGLMWQQCSREQNELCAACPPILRGVYSANEVFVGADPGGAECQTACRPGHYRLAESCRVCTSVANLQLQLDLQYGTVREFYRFEACAGAQDTLPVPCATMPNGNYTGDASATGMACVFECHAGFHAILGECVSCALPLDRNGLDLDVMAFTFTSTACDYECAADHMYVLRNATCVLCNASQCAVGSYLTGDNCSDCRACSRIALQNGLFISRGELDRPGSCAEECGPGFFADFDQCMPHSVVTCSPGEYQLPGSPFNDVMCLPCQDCHGRRTVLTCTIFSNAVCAACPALEANEELVGSNCSVQCLAGTLRNATGVCERCNTECFPGTYRDYTASQSCAQCNACPTPRNNSVFVDECMWECSLGHTLDSNTSLCTLEVSSVARRTELPTVRVQCLESEFRIGEFECRPCTELGVMLPAAEGLNVRWRWSRWAELGAGLCEFECLSPYLLFLGTDGSQICYTPAEYAAHVRLLHSELFPVEAPVASPVLISRLVQSTSESISRDFPGAYTVEIAAVSVAVGVVVMIGLCL